MHKRNARSRQPGSHMTGYTGTLFKNVTLLCAERRGKGVVSDEGNFTSALLGDRHSGATRVLRFREEVELTEVC